MSKIQRAAEIFKHEGLYELSLAMRRYLKDTKDIIRTKKAAIISNEHLIHKIGGLNVTVPVKTAWQRDHFGTLHNEGELLEDIVKELKEDDVFFDVGAYLGWHSLAARSAIEQGDVIAFEPHPVSYKRLCEVTTEVSQREIRAYNVGLSDREENVPMSKKARNNSQIHWKEEVREGEEFISIKTVIGDEFITEKKLPCPTILKIDVEGWEVATIKGLKTSINRQKCRLVYCELHPHKAPEGEKVKNKVTNLLEDAGFKIRTSPHSGSKTILKAQRY